MHTNPVRQVDLGFGNPFTDHYETNQKRPNWLSGHCLASIFVPISTASTPQIAW